MTDPAGSPATPPPGAESGTGAGAYIGRFAPSPTGPLHLGSVVAAIGSWLDARANGGRWHLRIDDLDTARNVAGAESLIVDELRRLTLEWDGPIVRQSENIERYHEVVNELRACGAAFDCGCSRRDLIAGVYPGTCRQGLKPGASARSVRFRISDADITIDDRLQGAFRQNLASEVGDFVLLRADGVIAYHLATVLDDAAAGVTDVVRGADLLSSSPRQVALQQALKLPTPRYAHLPVVRNDAGQKLSKQTHAPASTARQVKDLWCEALHFLGIAQAATMPRQGLQTLALKELRDWALQHWQVTNKPGTVPRSLPES